MTQLHVPPGHATYVGPRALPGTQVCPSVLMTLFMLMGSLDCAQMYKRRMTHRCHLAIPQLDVSFLLCPHACV